MLSSPSQQQSNHHSHSTPHFRPLTMNKYSLEMPISHNPENNLQLHQPQQALRREPNHHKLKKKLSKLRRKERQEQSKRQARGRIGSIIQQFYQGKACFQDYREQIQEQMLLVYKTDFRDYVQQLIQMRVNHLQKNIWEYTQMILDENPFQSDSDHAFYSQMVDLIYNLYLEIQHASVSIQKIINVYISYQQNNMQQIYPQQNLAQTTFNYMIQTDPTLKNLLHICDKKISPQKKWYRDSLAYLLSLIHQDSDQQDPRQCPPDEANHSQQPQKLKKRKKSKNNKISGEQQQLLLRMEQFVLRQHRVECRVSEEAVDRWQKRARQYRSRAVETINSDQIDQSRKIKKSKQRRQITTQD